MSGGTYDRNETYREESYTSADSDAERRRLLAKREERIKGFRSEIGEKADKPRPTRDVRRDYNAEYVRKAVTQPAPGVKRVYVVLIDNSGSNQKIANHFRNSTNYLRVNLGLVDPEAQYVFVYFSDHCDGDQWWQAVDYISPTLEGEKVMTSTLFHIDDADGGDRPEAHECALLDACGFNFGEVTERHLILISDVTGHGMGMQGDNGCRYQRDWQTSLDNVEKIYQTFEMIGCGDDPDVAELQQQFIAYQHPELLKMNFISLAHIKNSGHRLGIVLNAFLFLVARHRGMQTVEGFLSRLYEKWINDPVFGGDTDRRAKEAILRFAKYVPGQSEETRSMMSRVLVTTPAEIDDLLKQGAVLI